LRPQAFDLSRIENPTAGDLLANRAELLANGDVSLGMVTLAAPMPWF
jgi:hypothetical protein